MALKYQVTAQKFKKIAEVNCLLYLKKFGSLSFYKLGRININCTKIIDLHKYSLCRMKLDLFVDYCNTI